MFKIYPTYSRYRTLQLTTPQLAGEDVYALQLALARAGYSAGTPDGVLGPKTAGAITAFQRGAVLTADGKAGLLTQHALAMNLAREVSGIYHIPLDCFRGQLELESGFRLGNYSPQRPDGSYDAGVVQRNTQFTKPESGFDPVLSIAALGENIHRHYALFVGLGTHRRWALAQGAWNAPAFACFIAREEGAKAVTKSMTLAPNYEQRKTFEAYVANASAYLSDLRV